MMKFIDKYPGVPLCFLLFIYDKIRSLFRPHAAEDGTPVRNILIIKFWGLGSIVLVSPAIKALKSAFPEASISIITLCSNIEISGMIEEIDEVVCLEIRKGFLRFTTDTFAALYKLRKQKIDITVDFEFFTRFSAIITYLSGASRRVGFHAYEVWRGKLHTKEVPFNRYWHVSKNFLNLAVAAGARPRAGSDISFRDISTYGLDGLKIDQASLDYVDKLLLDSGAKDEKLVVININAASLALERRWPREKFLELSKKMLLLSGVKLAFVGGKEDVSYVSDVVSDINDPKIINLAGQLSIGQLAALFKKSELLVTNDSGPLHLAVAVGVPTVSFFGPETPVLYGPIGENHTVFFKGIDCSPCINVHDSKTVRCRSGKAKCMESIEVDEVLNHVSQYLREKSEAAG